MADQLGNTYFTNAASGIYRTDNVGALWKPIFKGADYATYIRGSSHSVSVSPLDLNHIAAVSTGGTILITSNGGGSWSRNNNKVLGFAGFNSNIVYGTNSVIYVASENPAGQSVCVTRTDDGGRSWQAASAGLPNAPISKLSVLPNTGGRTVFAATFLGVYRSDNFGVSWTQFGAGLPTAQVSDLYIPADGSFLRASTYGRGVWDVSLR